MRGFLATICGPCAGLSLFASGALAISINNPSPLPSGMVSVFYLETLTASGAIYPVWSVSAGTLPPGLSLDESTGDILGTPTSAGTYHFTVHVQELGTPDQAESNFELVIQSSVGVPSVTAARTGIGAPYPNPFRFQAKIPITLAHGARARVDILDLRGVVVRKLLDSELGAGGRVLSWDGRDGRGARCAAGLYFLRLGSNGIVQVRRVLLAP